MALIPGTRLGVYEVTAQIGEGGMGQVFRARDTRLNRDVALKVLPDSFARGKPVDRRADIWAFGCVVYEMVTGVRPFMGDDISLTLAAVLKEKVDFRTHWTARAGSIVRQTCFDFGGWKAVRTDAHAQQRPSDDCRAGIRIAYRGSCFIVLQCSFGA